MYSDYEVAYESNINEFLIPMLIGIGILIVILIICLVAMMRIFKKANRSGIAAIIPIYNIMIMLEIVNKAKWQIILFLIPIVNIIIYCETMFKISKSFRKTDAFAIGTVLLPFIFLPILGFSDSEYIGINKEAMMGSSIAMDIPVVPEQEEEATPVVEKKETKPLDISIGGGVYQKDYEESLLRVPEAEVKSPGLASFRVETEEIKPLVKEEKTGADLLKDVSFIETDVKEETSNIVNNAEIKPIESIQTVIETPKEEIKQQEAVIPVIPPIENNTNDAPKVPEYIPCPNCGAMIKKDSPKCFMCGKAL